ncbi:MAG: hypothetical protein HGA65_01730 [Oscillochloris sp.]|nr:hypothetical protein [Oscillochloris sp.]
MRTRHICSTTFLIFFSLLAAFLAPTGARAQTGGWNERPTSTFSILYTAGEEAEAERYAGFIDTIYDEIATAFSYRPSPPLTLRLYPTSDSYYQANPGARNVPGIIAHADFRRREVVVIVERTLQQSDEEVRNNIRHELTHIVASDLSDGRLNTGFQEGIAQYMERPSADLDLRIAALSQASDQGRLLPWSALDNRDTIYSNPEVSYPQTLAIVAFLVDQNGFATLRQFLSASAQSSGYRIALEQTYGASVSTLEAEWQAWLPSYLAGGYRSNALDRYDISYARTLVEQGDYATAMQELTQAIDWIARHSDTQPGEVSTEAIQLKERADDGLRATQLAEHARSALVEGDYERTQQLVEQARIIFARIEDTRQDSVLATYAERAARGLAASADLAQADALARRLRLPQARASAELAAQEFAALGDQLRLANALELRRTLNSRQRMLGAVLLVAGFAGVLLSLIGRFLQPPSEHW